MAQRPLKHIEVVAAVIVDSGSILCMQRGNSRLSYISEKWEFPGGKVEPGEDQVTALRREILEELQVQVSVWAHILTVKHEYPDFSITMHAYECKLLNSKTSLILTEHKSLLWLSPLTADFENLDWAAADLPIVQAIRENK
jgi:8-oxo-dGTP diphosphatase